MKLANLHFALLLAAAGAVRADPASGDVTYGATVPSTKIGISLGLGGGATGFSASEATDVTSVGETWEVRTTVGTRLPVAGELAYVGSRRSLGVAGVTGASSGETPHLFAHGIEGAARFQFPYVAGSWLLEPFAFVGVGWTHVGVDATVPAGAPMGTSDDLLVVPFGAGFSGAWHGLVLEGRFTYRSTFSDDLLKNADGSNVNLANWSVGGLIGYEF